MLWRVAVIVGVLLKYGNIDLRRFRSSKVVESVDAMQLTWEEYHLLPWYDKF
jgi:hypothetical protein